MKFYLERENPKPIPSILFTSKTHSRGRYVTWGSVFGVRLASSVNDPEICMGFEGHIIIGGDYK